MGATKKHIHTQGQIELARLFKALGHPARIAIVENLLEHESLNCNALRSYIQLAQSTISVHLRELQEVGILGVRVEGNNAYYEVNKFMLVQITNYLDKLYVQIDRRRIGNRFLVYFNPDYIIQTRNFMNNS